ncbi:hypothetical protein Syun_021994 [Stephania yunnanensis]|uniref:FAD-binding PCMH-type domain-containing protein n=1 Tax=Stephania yunnanensis TaxID=152371 RepID=A0AAP0IH03_9MAGN
MAGQLMRCPISLRPVSAFLVCIVLLSSCTAASPILTAQEADSDFLECISFNTLHTKLPVYTPNTTSYTSILQSKIQNLRFSSDPDDVPPNKPRFIVTPTHESHVQAVVVCSKKHDLQIRVRSGGHDFEGLSYRSDVPFVLIDLFNLRTIDVNIGDDSAWVEAGATLGEVYYRIAEKSPVHAFSAGKAPTIGVGGHISGAGHGTLLRKYGTAADNIIDARLVNVNGEVLNRETMGEDLFWAIRGGGAASFGVVLAWKIKLVAVPPTVTVSTLNRTYEEGVTELVHKWQTIASREVPEELNIEVEIFAMKKKKNGSTIVATYRIMYLGPSKKLMQLMEDKFAELGMEEKDFMEMSWIESVVYNAQFPEGMVPLERLLSRESHYLKFADKVKSDFVTKPMSKTRLAGIWRILEENGYVLSMVPWGGKVGSIPEDEIAFPHRDGNLYLIGYLAIWDNETTEAQEKHIIQVREMYDHMTPYVSKSPRAAYFIYRDLDLGQNAVNGASTYSSGCASWGQQYFKSNCMKLMKVKGKVDPDNFFRDEQTILANIHESDHPVEKDRAYY